MQKVMEAVQKELLRDPYVQTRAQCCKIIVSYDDGSLIIRGDVGTYYQKQMAQEAVRRVINGTAVPYLALTVRNELKVGQ